MPQIQIIQVGNCLSNLIKPQHITNLNKNDSLVYFTHQMIMSIPVRMGTCICRCQGAEAHIKLPSIKNAP